MKPLDGLPYSLEQSWKTFAGAWKKVRAEASEKSIHHLRVSTRRLIAVLELAKAVSRQEDIAKLQRRFKKVLKRMGPLRDTQVLLESISHLRLTALISDFRQD